MPGSMQALRTHLLQFFMSVRLHMGCQEKRANTLASVPCASSLVPKYKRVQQMLRVTSNTLHLQTSSPGLCTAPSAPSCRQGRAARGAFLFASVMR